MDVLLCCGDFQATRNLADLKCMAVPDKFKEMGTFYKYYSGELKAPILTFVIGGNHEASNHMQELPFGGLAWLQLWSLGPGRRYMPTDKFYANYFFIKIDQRWWIFVSFNVIFPCQKSAKSVKFLFSLKNIKIEEELLFMTLFDHLYFWSTLFSKILPNFLHAQSNSN